MKENQLILQPDPSTEAILESKFSVEAIEDLNQATFGTDKQLDTPAEVEKTLIQLEARGAINRVDLEKGESPTQNNDIILGTEQADNIFALGGDDIVNGDRGLNSIANDTIDGGSGDDIIFGEGGNDLISGADGSDKLFGDADPNVALFDAPFGNDTLFGGSGKDELFGGNGDDSLDGGSGKDDLFGGDDNDRLIGGRGRDRLFGGKGNDTLEGGNGHDIAYGQEGNDTIYGDRGNDLLYGDRFNRVVGGSAEDSIYGGKGNDTLIGGVGRDSLDGGSGSDRLLGVDPSAQVDFGRSTIDTLTGGGGSDVFVLGEGKDIFYNGGIPGNEGTRDYALVTDFEFRQDSLDVAGSQDNYSVDFTSGSLPDGLAVYYQPTPGDRELIAVLEIDNIFSSSASTNTLQANTGNNFASVERPLSEESFVSSPLFTNSIKFV